MQKVFYLQYPLRKYKQGLEYFEPLVRAYYCYSAILRLNLILSYVFFNPFSVTAYLNKKVGSHVYREEDFSA